MDLNRLVMFGLALTVLGAAGQTVPDAPSKESQTPAPPAFDVKRLIPIDMPKYVALRFGVDPATLFITPDGIVRYVVVINPTGTITALYEGIRCSTGEVQTIARYSHNGKWSVVADPQWQALTDNLRSKHALALARQGLCEGRSVAARSVPDMVKALTLAQDRF